MRVELTSRQPWDALRSLTRALNLVQYLLAPALDPVWVIDWRNGHLSHYGKHYCPSPVRTAQLQSPKPWLRWQQVGRMNHGVCMSHGELHMNAARRFGASPLGRRSISGSGRANSNVALLCSLKTEDPGPHLRTFMHISVMTRCYRQSVDSAVELVSGLVQ